MTALCSIELSAHELNHEPFMALIFHSRSYSTYSQLYNFEVLANRASAINADIE